MKTCTVCNESKPFDAFYNRKASEDGKAYRCKECDNKAVKAHRKLHRDRYLDRQMKANRLHKYGLTHDDYEQMLKDQDSCCWICQKRVPLVVDHNHDTGKVRGLLCKPCNQALGLFYDDVESLERAINYLKSIRKELNIGT